MYYAGALIFPLQTHSTALEVLMKIEDERTWSVIV